ncbi:hypothetical protein MPTK1_8g00100 [Marchantia polymorpha subsp. ruderalis]|uniref:Uncharacterized protein n=1 Tax=Marchantia polymorpha TaxID=3197 RepID=A0A2R6WLK4_MARPO|nr:hypothetical protein MARPO_0077s0058 [Marchantia polymorpha]BBN18144.1 hypothetical protein Mp_8g00100 [Marchantia polymorpha subsp. ruderalis]|eukprot:PTQ34738.1 hypothetical protein MARPO_0077s0058 [Marchantia polymorpha]
MDMLRPNVSRRSSLGDRQRLHPNITTLKMDPFLVYADNDRVPSPTNSFSNYSCTRVYKSMQWSLSSTSRPLWRQLH